MSKFCSKCGKEMPDETKFCPNCGADTGQSNDITSNSVESGNNAGRVNGTENAVYGKPRKKHGCLFKIVFVLVILGVACAVIWGTTAQNSAIQKSMSGASDSSEYITLDEFNKIDTDMSYDDVKGIVGSDGEVTSQVDSNGIKIVMVTWYGNGVAGSNANVTFTNDKVTAKAQVGLK